MQVTARAHTLKQQQQWDGLVNTFEGWGAVQETSSGTTEKGEPARHSRAPETAQIRQR